MTNTRAAVVGLLAITAAASAQQASVLTIDDAVALALKGNREVQSAELEVDRARQQSAALKTTRLPQFHIYTVAGELLRAATATIPQGALGSYQATGPIPGQTATVTMPRTFAGFILGQVLQPGSQLYKIHLSLISSKINEDLAQQRLRQKKQDTVQSVRELYYQIAETQMQIESVEADVKALDALQGETDRRLVELAALKSDSLAVRARLSHQRYELVKLRDSDKTQKESFNRLLGRNLNTEFSVEVQPVPALEEIDLTVAHTTALRQRPEMEQARLQTRKAETEVRRQRAERIPDISAGFTYATFPNLSFLPQNFLAAGFQVEWEPFDWGRKRHLTQALRDATKQSALAERDTEQQIVIDVDEKFRALAEARLLLDTTALAQESQREKLRETANRYREKAVLLSNFLQEEHALVQADSDYENALSAFWKAKAGFDRALGREY
jgi:outer membrane protein